MLSRDDQNNSSMGSAAWLMQQVAMQMPLVLLVASKQAHSLCSTYGTSLCQVPDETPLASQYNALALQASLLPGMTLLIVVQIH